VKRNDAAARPPSIGFLTNIFYWEGSNDFQRILEFAAGRGFSCLEIGPTVPLEEATMEAIAERGLFVSDLIYCRNLLSGDRQAAARHRKEVRRRLDFAARFDIPIVTISAGITGQGDTEAYDSYEAIRPYPERRLEPFLATYGPLVEEAEKRGVRLAIENCPIMGNWAISPYLWEKLFDRLGSPALGLAYDPCHLAWQLIDPYAPIAAFGERIFHVHAKDVSVDRDRLAWRGILTDFSWWESRIPGWGQLDWVGLIAQLRRVGYGGVLSIEHEDPRFRGSIEKVEDGLALGREHLEAAARLAADLATSEGEPSPGGIS
jgi:sugar phosphate isomerase/epimerase